MKRLQLSIYYLQELNYRLAYAAFGTAFFFFTTYNYKQGLIFIILPRGLSHFVSAGLTEIFFTYIELCTILTFSVGVFIILIQIYLFLRPGFYKYEAQLIFNTLIITIFFYICLYILVFPLLTRILWELFSTYSQNFMPIHLTFEPRLNDYLNHIQQINKILTFSFPCIMCLNLLQMYTTKQLWIKYRGLAYILAFSIAAFITPPDILSQTLVGLPLIFFYEMQIAFWALFKSYKNFLLVRQPIKSHKNTLRNKK